MKKKNDPFQITRHHINPRSRQKGKGVVGVCLVPRFRHELYHHLFGNMFPYEILEFINKIFWNNEYEITIKKKERRT